jgi:hypothetical protein
LAVVPAFVANVISISATTENLSGLEGRRAPVSYQPIRYRLRLCWRQVDVG